MPQLRNTLPSHLKHSSREQFRPKALCARLHRVSCVCCFCFLINYSWSETGTVWRVSTSCLVRYIGFLSCCWLDYIAAFVVDLGISSYTVTTSYTDNAPTFRLCGVRYVSFDPWKGGLALLVTLLVVAKPPFRHTPDLWSINPYFPSFCLVLYIGLGNLVVIRDLPVFSQSPSTGK